MKNMYKYILNVVIWVKTEVCLLVYNFLMGFVDGYVIADR